MARYLQQLSVRPAAAQPRPQAVPSSGSVVLLRSLGSAGPAVAALGHQVGQSIDENKVAIVLGRIDEGWHKKDLAILAWSALITSSLVLALVLQALVATALVASGSDAPADCESPADAAPADGDDLRARFMADLCGGSIGPTPMSCSVPATKDKACIS